MSRLKEIRVPDLGNVAAAAIIEIPVKEGQTIAVEDAIVTLESDKASMDIPSPLAGKIKQLKVKLGDKISKGDLIALIETADEAMTVEAPAAPLTSAPAASTEAPKPEIAAAISDTKISSESNDEQDDDSEQEDSHAGPGVRRLAREFGLDLAKITGTGQKGRILKEDLHKFVKVRLSQAGGNNSLALPAAPEIDFNLFGETEKRALSRIKKLTGQNLHRNWLQVPHVTQFNEADITELEAFCKA